MTIVTNAVHELLTRAQDLIRDPEAWIQGEFALDSQGYLASPESEHATCFCSLGALFHAEPTLTDDRRTARSILNRASKLVAGFEITVPNFNDNHTHEVVMAMWDKARELALA
jgi:hypothetical protein